MGYSYDSKHHLCCDSCGASPALKYPCPWRWCGPIVLCARCRQEKKHLLSRAYHRGLGCEAAHDHARIRQAWRNALLAQGKYVRHSALSVWKNGRDTGQVHVLFSNRHGETIGRFMSGPTYDSIGILEPATPEDFAKFGPITDAPPDFVAEWSGSEYVSALA